MKKFVALLVALVVVGLLAQPRVRMSLLLPFKLHAAGISSSADSDSLQRQLESKAPKGTSVKSREHSKFSSIFATVTLPENTSSEEIRAYVEHVESIAKEQPEGKDTHIDIAAHMSGHTVRFSSAKGSPPLPEQFEKAQQLAPQIGDLGTGMSFYLQSVSLNVNREIPEATDCATALRKNTQAFELGFNAVSLAQCGGAHIYVYKTKEPHLDSLAEIITQLPHMPPDTSITAHEDGRLTVHYEKRAPDKTILEGWPHGKVEFYAK